MLRVSAESWRVALAEEPRLTLAEAPEAATPVQAVLSEEAVVGRVVDDGIGGAWAWAAADDLAHGPVGNAVDALRVLS